MYKNVQLVYVQNPLKVINKNEIRNLYCETRRQAYTIKAKNIHISVSDMIENSINIYITLSPIHSYYPKQLTE